MQYIMACRVSLQEMRNPLCKDWFAYVFVKLAILRYGDWLATHTSLLCFEGGRERTNVGELVEDSHQRKSEIQEIDLRFLEI